MHCRARHHEEMPYRVIERDLFDRVKQYADGVNDTAAEQKPKTPSAAQRKYSVYPDYARPPHHDVSNETEHLELSHVYAVEYYGQYRHRRNDREKRVSPYHIGARASHHTDKHNGRIRAEYQHRYSAVIEPTEHRAAARTVLHRMVERAHREHCYNGNPVNKNGNARKCRALRNGFEHKKNKPNKSKRCA